jgi:hypothetical protein
LIKGRGRKGETYQGAKLRLIHLKKDVMVKAAKTKTLEIL